MKIQRRIILSGLLCLGAVAPTQAVEPAKPANPLSFADGKVTFDVQERLRMEVRVNNFDFNDKPTAVGIPTDGTFLLQRFRLGMMLKPCDWVNVYAQGQDVWNVAAQRPGVPFAFGSEGNDPFDLRQAYIEVGNLKKFPAILKVGRQELSYGDERLIGAFDWNNFSRTFDAAKVRYGSPSKKWWVDVFAGNVVHIEGTGPEANNGFDFNDSSWDDNMVGIYMSTTIVEFQTTDLYFIFRDKDGNGPVYTAYSGTVTNNAAAYDIAQQVWTPGFRIKSVPGKLAGWDYEVEAAYQFGHSAGQQGTTFPATKTISHQAFATHIGAGYTWTNVVWKPRLGLEFNAASGDRNPNDNKDESFLNLFPTNHKFYGYMDLFAWKNMYNTAASLKCTPYQDKERPWHSVALQLDGHAFWLFTNQDAWYRANGVARVRPLNASALSANTFVGTELDFVVTYNSRWKWMKWQAGYCHFFSGNYVQDTANQAAGAGSDDADFGYLQTTIAF